MNKDEITPGKFDKPTVNLDVLLCQQLAQAKKEIAFARVDLLLERDLKHFNIGASEHLIKYWRLSPSDT